MHTPDGSATLLDFAHSLYAEHLGESIDAHIRAVRYSRMSPGVKPRERRFAIASVVHGHACLEAVANIFKFEVYDSKDSRFFVPVDEADLAMTRFLKDWNRIEVEERCAFLLRTQDRVLDAALKMHICEVRELRNLLAHGYTMPGVILFQDIPGEPSVEYDVSHPKQNRFPRLKFSRPDNFVHSDSRKALEVCLQAVHEVARTFGPVLSCTSYEVEPTGIPLYLGGAATGAPVERILQQIDIATAKDATARATALAGSNEEPQ